MRSPSQRDALLTWFLQADLEADESVARLRALTGRAAAEGFEAHQIGPVDGVWWVRAADRAYAKELAAIQRRRGKEVIVAEPEAIGPSGESDRAEHRGPNSGGPTTRADFVAEYVSVQWHLREVQRLGARLAGHRRRRKLDDSYGMAFFALARLLADVRLDIARDDSGRVRVPLEAANLSVSLVGELALAMFERLLEAKASVNCPYCKRVELFADARRRENCGREECRDAYRREWKRRKPEDPAAVYARVLRSRGVAESEIDQRVRARRKRRRRTSA